MFQRILLSKNVLKISQENVRNFIINLQVKGNAQFFQKVTFEPLIDFKQNMQIGNVTKAATFKSSLHQTYKSVQLLLL